MAEEGVLPENPAGDAPSGSLKLNRLPVELRPAGALLRYYALSSLVAGPFFFLPLAFLYFRFRTLRYQIDEDGIAMRWGALFRREVSLNYGRIQDIHLSSNVVERWLGLGKIQVQTASGSSGAEMTIEGVPEVRALRDFLYARMRGARAGGAPAAAAPAGGAGALAVTAPAGEVEELTAALRQVAAEVRALRASVLRAGDVGGEDAAGA